MESASGAPESRRKQLWKVRGVNFKPTLSKLTLESPFNPTRVETQIGEIKEPEIVSLGATAKGFLTHSFFF